MKEIEKLNTAPLPVCSLNASTVSTVPSDANYADKANSMPCSCSTPSSSMKTRYVTIDPPSATIVSGSHVSGKPGMNKIPVYYCQGE
jgi:hypothetical protein